MRPAALLIGILALAAAEQRAPDVTIELARETLAAARPHLVRLTGAEWPEGLAVERIDLAGLRARLLADFRLQVRALHPERSAASREHLAGVLATGLARTLRVRYDRETKKLLVAPGDLASLPEGLVPGDALTFMTVRQAALGLCDAGTGREKDDEGLRAHRMLIEGRAEHLASQVAPLLGAPRETGARLATVLERGERMTREWGRRFFESLAARDAELPDRALDEMPRTTAVLFHPARFGAVEPGVPGAGAEFEPVSELLLRLEFEERIGAARTAEVFESYMAGATSGTRSVHVLENDAAARAFLEARALSRGGKSGQLEGSWVSPTGLRLVWRLRRAGRIVEEDLAPKDE